MRDTYYSRLLRFWEYGWKFEISIFYRW